MQRLANLKISVGLKIEKNHHSGESKGRLYTIICRSKGENNSLLKNTCQFT